MQSNSERIRQFYAEVATGGAVDRIDEFCTEDLVEHEGFPGISNDREGVKQFFAMMHAAFPDLRWEPVTVMEDGDRVIARYHLTGTHQGEFLGIAPTGRRIDMEGYDEARLIDGRACEHWGAMDTLELMQQLGAVPEPAPAA
jgi:predicted ester cyclase